MHPALIGLPVALLLSAVAWLQQSNVPAFPEAIALLQSTDDITVQHAPFSNVPGYLFTTRASSKKGAVIYPGGRVEPEAYAPLCTRLLTTYQNEYSTCYLATFPLNLAFLDTNQANRAVSALKATVSEWVFIGHSLGGAFVSEAAKTADESSVAGFVMLDSYPSKDISQIYKQKSLLVQVGTMSLDKTAAQVKNAKSNSPSTLKVHLVPGGNHAGYAYYEAKEDDLVATMTKDEQIGLALSHVTKHF